MPKAAISWSDDRIELLKKCHADGMSATETAKCMGYVTRNAVLGKIHRLGLSGPVRIAAEKKPRAPRPPREHKQRDRYNHAARRIIPAFESVETIKLRCVEIEPRHLTLLDLEKDDCRYPYGDGQITFCGHPQVAGSSYCAPHFHLSRGQGTSGERAATRASTKLLAVA